MDIALEVGIFDTDFSFPDDGFMTSCLNDSSLMEGKGAEITFTETSAVGCQGELDLLQGRYSACLFV